MARLPRSVFPGIPHLVTQRGLDGGQVFFSVDDNNAYIALLAKAAQRWQVTINAWCLMPNHVHLLLTPTTAAGITQFMSTVNRAYAVRMLNRQNQAGRFWHGRFAAVALDQDASVTALKYILTNPVRAKLCFKARDWRWSNARSLCTDAADPLSQSAPLLRAMPNLPDLLSARDATLVNDTEFTRLRKAESIGRPVGTPAFLAQLEQASGRILQAKKRGRPAGQIQ